MFRLKSKNSEKMTKNRERGALDKILAIHRDLIAQRLNELFFSHSFDNIHTLSPTCLERYGYEETSCLEAYLSNRDSKQVLEHGRMRADAGLCIQAILEMFHCFSQFYLEHIPEVNDLRMTRTAMMDISEYAYVYLDGYWRASKERVIRQQTQIRKALSATLTAQRQDLFVRTYAMESSINGILLADLNNRVTYVNPAFEKMWGYTASNRPPGSADVRHIAGDKVNQILRVLSTNVCYRKELRLARTDGTKFDVDMSASRIVDREGKVFGFMACFVDITERKIMEARFRNAHKMNALVELAAGISHDFNNVFAIVGTYLQILLNSVEENSQMYDDLRQIDIALDRSAGLTKQLQLFARGVDSDPQRVDLNQIVKENYDLLKYTMPMEIDVNLSLDEALWPVVGDPSQLSQVVINFCVNARDAILSSTEDEATEDTRSDPETGIIEIRTQNIFRDAADIDALLDMDSDRYVHLAISDNGSGMLPEVQERLFEPFYSTKRDVKNSGLGLSIIYGIIKNLDGQIEVHSEVGKGSRFDVYLPASKQPPPLLSGGGRCRR